MVPEVGMIFACKSLKLRDSKMSTKGKVLITGYGGFTGKLLGEKLTALDYKVNGLVINEPTSLDVFKVDITDYTCLLTIIKTVKPDFIII